MERRRKNLEEKSLRHPTTYVTCHVSHGVCHLSLITCHISHIKCQVSRVTCHMSHVTCHMSHAIYHVSHVTCHMLHVTYNMSCVTCDTGTFVLEFGHFQKRWLGVNNVQTFWGFLYLVWTFSKVREWYD